MQLIVPEITSLSSSQTSVKMYSLKGIGLIIVILANVAKCQTEGSGSDDDDYYGNICCRVFKCGVQN